MYPYHQQHGNEIPVPEFQADKGGNGSWLHAIAFNDSKDNII